MSIRRPPLEQLSINSPGTPRQQIIPHLIETGDVPDFGNANAIRRVGLVPSKDADQS